LNKRNFQEINFKKRSAAIDWRSALAVLSSAIFLGVLPQSPPLSKEIAHVIPTLTEHFQSHLTVAETVKLYGKDARTRILPFFKKAQVPYPPAKLTFLSLKQERVLIVFAPDGNGGWKQINGYYVVGTSGKAGPKLKEGDLQIPEGFYRITGLYPNSIAHLGLRINYPNAQDKLRAKNDKRTKLGGDILIHGSYWSTGCLAMGNAAIEEIYIMANDVGCRNIEMIFAPCNLKTTKPDIDFKKQPDWVPILYRDLTTELKLYPIKIDPQWQAKAPARPTND